MCIRDRAGTSFGANGDPLHEQHNFYLFLRLTTEQILEVAPLLYQGNYEVQKEVCELIKKKSEQLENPNIVQLLVVLQEKIQQYSNTLSLSLIHI